MNSMRHLRILRWTVPSMLLLMAGGRVSSQGTCDWNYAATARSRAVLECWGAQRCGCVGCTEVRTLADRGTLRWAHTGRGTQRCSAVIQLPSLCQQQLYTLPAYSSLPLTLLWFLHHLLEATLLISRKCQVTWFAYYKACQMLGQKI